MKKALIVIDLQKDYFEGGKFPLVNTEQVLEKTLKLIRKADEEGIKLIYIQHIAPTQAPFFAEGSQGVDLHPTLLEVSKAYSIVEKRYADSFYGTRLREVLENHSVEELYICGMMTQNCVTHTALSREADKYRINIIGDCCTTVDQTINHIALKAMEVKVEVKDFGDIRF